MLKGDIKSKQDSISLSNIDKIFSIAYNLFITNSNVTFGCKGQIMDNILLGLLLLHNRTIYQLRERINQGLNLMYSSSMGSIQAAVKKLLNCEYIGYEEVVENGKYKKIYFITESGKLHFSEWINSPLEIQNVRNPELAKIYFMGFSDGKSRVANIEEHLSHLTEQYDALKVICEEADRINVSKEQKDIFFYQLAAARYGRDFMKFNIEWYKKLLDEMRSEKDGAAQNG